MKARGNIAQRYPHKKIRKASKQKFGQNVKQHAWVNCEECFFRWPRVAAHTHVHHSSSVAPCQCGLSAREKSYQRLILKSLFQPSPCIDASLDDHYHDLDLVLRFWTNHYSSIDLSNVKRLTQSVAEAIGSNAMISAHGALQAIRDSDAIAHQICFAVDSRMS